MKKILFCILPLIILYFGFINSAQAYYLDITQEIYTLSASVDSEHSPYFYQTKTRYKENYFTEEITKLYDKSFRFISQSYCLASLNKYTGPDMTKYAIHFEGTSFATPGLENLIAFSGNASVSFFIVKDPGDMNDIISVRLEAGATGGNYNPMQGYARSLTEVTINPDFNLLLGLDGSHYYSGNINLMVGELYTLKFSLTDENDGQRSSNVGTEVGEDGYVALHLNSIAANNPIFFTPLPSSLILFGSGFLFLVKYRRK